MSFAWTILAAVPFTLIGCTSVVHPQFEHHLISDWALERHIAMPATEPFIGIYQRKNKSLAFIAAKHELGASSDVQKLVIKTFSSFQPKAVIAEGFDETTPRDWLINKANECARSEFKNCGEQFQAIYLANNANIPFSGGEPSDTTIEKELFKVGYSTHDMVGFYLVRQLPLWDREKTFEVDGIEKLCTEFICDQYETYLHKPCDMTYTQFLSWYQEKMGKTFDFHAITTEYTAPYDDEKSTWLQRMSAQIGKIRDRTLLRVIEKQLQLYDKVMVVYGWSHFMTLRHVFEKTMGLPVVQDES